MTEPAASLGLVIGRFQPFHRGHEVMCRQALANHEQLLVVLGSGRQAPSIKNPWTDAQREQLIRESLPDIAPQRLSFEVVPDVFYNEAVWLDWVRIAVEKHAGTGADAQAVTLYGHNKDSSSYYLALFPQWHYVELPNYRGLSATPMREALLDAGPDSAVSRVQGFVDDLPAVGVEPLQRLLATPEFVRACADYQVAESYRRAWAGAPYPPIFQTVDALVECAGQILLIQRGAAPGADLWALPGGFLNVDERLEAGARRELQEETGLNLDALNARLIASRAYDAPERSARGRFVTQLFHYQLDQPQVPAVQGGDDAAQARWWDFDAIDPLQMFEDHYCILQHALNRYG